MKSIEDIKKVIEQASSPDGESLEFELKGSSGEIKFTKDLKKLLSKEICAFANTYGGRLCFHYGKGKDIEAFPESSAKGNFNQIESWLRDSLEPKLIGISLEIIDNVYIINIPESRTKPHRTASSFQYHYRHSTISQTMPEIMISSMYRSQEYLSYTASVNVFKSNNQLTVHVYIKNHSNLSGSKPNIQIQLFAAAGKQLEFIGHYFEKCPTESFQSSNLIQTLKIPTCAMLSSNSKLSDRLLYPQDRISFSSFSNADDKVKDIKYLLVRMDCMFKEALRQTEYKLIEYKGDGTQEILMTSQEDGNALFVAFHKLINEHSK